MSDELYICGYTVLFFSYFLVFFKCFLGRDTLLMCTRTALLLFITCHLLNWEWQGLAGADNELGVETVRVRPCRRGHCSPEWLIGQSVGVFEGECVSVSIKKFALVL